MRRLVALVLSVSVFVPFAACAKKDKENPIPAISNEQLAAECESALGWAHAYSVMALANENPNKVYWYSNVPEEAMVLGYNADEAFLGLDSRLNVMRIRFSDEDELEAMVEEEEDFVDALENSCISDSIDIETESGSDWGYIIFDGMDGNTYVSIREYYYDDVLILIALRSELDGGPGMVRSFCNSLGLPND